MANRHPSAMKRARQNERRRQRNTMLRSATRTTVKKVLVAAERRDVSIATTELTLAIKALGKATTKGILHKNNAARKISRLTRKVNALVVAQG